MYSQERERISCQATVCKAVDQGKYTKGPEEKRDAVLTGRWDRERPGLSRNCCLGLLSGGLPHMPMDHPALVP